MNDRAAASLDQLAQLVAERIDYGRLADELAPRVVECLELAAPSGERVTAKQLAERFGRTPRYWRDHADEFGGERVGDGPRPRIDFDPALVERILGRRKL